MAFTTSQLNAGNTGTSIPSKSMPLGQTQLSSEMLYAEPQNLDSQVTVYLAQFSHVIDHDKGPEKLADLKQQLDDELQGYLERHSDFSCILTRMYNNIDKYFEYLKECFRLFSLHNKKIHPVSYRVGKHMECFLNSGKLVDAPLHFSARQLNEKFFDWLLMQPETEINLRNKSHETALAILCQMYGSSKIKSKTKHSRILEFIEKLLLKGATFNIYHSRIALPFDFLKRFLRNKAVAEIIGKCVDPYIIMTKVTQVKNQPKQRVLTFFKQPSDDDITPTVELLEIFMRFDDKSKFNQFWEKFIVTANNVKQVITLLLSVACNLNYTDYVENIVDKASVYIFARKTNKGTGNRVARPEHSVLMETAKPIEVHCRWSSRTHKEESQDSNDSDTSDESTRSSHSNESRSFEREGNEMIYQQELTLLLTTICLKGNDRLLDMFLSKMSDEYILGVYFDLKKKLEKQQTMRHVNCLEKLDDHKKKIEMKLNEMSQLETIMHQVHVAQSVNATIPSETEKSNEIGLDRCITTNQDETVLNFDVNYFCPEALTKRKNTPQTQGYHSISTASDLMDLDVFEHDDREEILMHPVFNAFIAVKLKRISHLHILHLLLTIAILLFLTCSLQSFSGTSKNLLLGMTIVVGLIFLVREVFLLWLLRLSYFSLEKAVSFINLAIIFTVIGCQYGQSIVCYYVSCLYAFVATTMFFKASFLLGIILNNLFLTNVMSKAVRNAFSIGLLLLCVTIFSFIYSFVCMNSETISADLGNSSFCNTTDAVFKIVLMKTSAFDTMIRNLTVFSMVFAFVFVSVCDEILFKFVHGFAESNHRAEINCIRTKVEMLKRYDRALCRYRSGLPVCWQWLVKDALFPGSFFENYESIIFVKLNEKNKLEIKPKKRENRLAKKTEPYDAKNIVSEKGAKISDNHVHPIPILPFFPSHWLQYYFAILSFKLVLFVTLEQSIVEKAKKLLRNQT